MDGLYDVFIDIDLGTMILRDMVWMVCMMYLFGHRHEHYGTERHGWSV